MVRVHGDGYDVMLFSPGEIQVARPSIDESPDLYGVTKAQALDLTAAVLSSLPEIVNKPLVSGTVKFRERGRVLGPGTLKL